MSRKEAEIVVEADRALSVLREEGSAVAMPEAVGDMRDDMDQIVGRLAQDKTGEITQKIEEDVIAALEEMIAALQKAQKDLSDKKPMPGQGSRRTSGSAAGRYPGRDQGHPGDADARQQPHATLFRNSSDRTGRAARTGHRAKRLAEREERIFRVTRDIAVGRNQ